MFAFSVVLAFAVGLAMAAQTPTNAGLGAIVGSVQGSLVNFAVGFVCCVIAMLVAGTGDLSLALQAPAWQWMGGVYGAFVIFGLVVATPHLGVALMLTIMMLGQLCGGMVVDGFGLVGVAAIPITLLRIVGCALVLAGILFVHAGRERTAGNPGADGSGAGGTYPYMLLGLACGIAGAFQPPTNAALAASVGGTLEASVVSFGGGLVILLVATLALNKGRLASFKGARPWQFTGGIYGAFGVIGATAGTPVLGVSLWLAGTMLGQLVGGMAVDALGLFRVARERVTTMRAVGAAVLLVGIVCVTAAKLM